MLIKITLLVILANGSSVTGYFLEPSSKMMLPIRFHAWHAPCKDLLIKLFALAQFMGDKILFVNLRNDTKMSCIHVIAHDKRIRKLYVSSQIGIIFAQFFDLDIFIEHRTLLKRGLVVTTELIAETYLC